ncbi:hypothetical protein M9Y10_003104 [Tritrichomonas musculus]|uniref:Uncharacterized protein n=1 Tax=Tritrichomonas musculus TaxID=1915356 RepID=A0ABR2JRA8_9EUKA
MNRSLSQSPQTERDVVKVRKRRGEGPDAKKVSYLLQGFDERKSFAINTLYARFGSSLIHKELLAIAEFLVLKVQQNSRIILKISRDAKRDDKVLRKWYHDYWGLLAPEIECIQLYDEYNNLITGDNIPIPVPNQGQK